MSSIQDTYVLHNGVQIPVIGYGTIILDGEQTVTAVFYGMTGTLKNIIDRCHCFSKALTAKHMKFLFVATAWRTDREVMSYLENYFTGLSRYLGFRDVQMILAKGCGDKDSSMGSSYERKAYEIGRKC